jgi:hypothetical protein
MRQTSNPTSRTETPAIYARANLADIYSSCFPCYNRSLAPSAQYKEAASKETAEAEARDAKARLEWALAHKDWTAEDFRGDLQRRV